MSLSGAGPSGEFLELSRDLDVTAQELQQLRSMFELLYHEACAGLVLLSASRRILATNQTFCSMAGRSAGQMLESPFLSLVAAHESRAFLRALHGCPENGAGAPPSYLETTLVTRSGVQKHVAVWMQRVSDPPLGRALIQMTVVDSADALRHQEEGLQREAEARVLLRSAPDAIVALDDWGNIQTFNPAAERTFGYQADEVKGRHVTLLFHHPALGSVLDARPGGPALEAMARRVSLRGERKGGESFPVEFTLSEVALPQGRSWIAILRDVSERESLRHAAVEAGEQEQRRIGSDLHEGLSQVLSGLSMKSSVLARKLESTGHPEAPELRRMVATLGEAVGQLRRIAQGLHPVELETRGLGAALQSLAGDVSHFAGVECVLEKLQTSDSLDPNIAIHLFRIVQEAVQNALRHGHAGHIQISLESDREELRLTVNDDGSGLADHSGDSDGLGFTSMRERARILGGDLEIFPGAQSGTSLVCRVPAQPNAPGRKGRKGRCKANGD